MLKRRNSQSEDFFQKEASIKQNSILQVPHFVQKNLQTERAFCSLVFVRKCICKVPVCAYSRQGNSIMKTKITSRFILLMVITWGCCVATAIVAFAWYDVRSGSVQAAPNILPSTNLINARSEEGSASQDSSSERGVVAMFVHPRCPCSRASLTEFANLVRKLSSQAGFSQTQFRIIFFKPASQNLAWVKRDNLFERASALASTRKNVSVSIDEDGTEAARFNAETSGFVVAYDAHGRLLFSGGITESRGHEGANAGEATLEATLEAALKQGYQSNAQGTQTAYAPVFGCAIRTNSANTASASK
jgi:hypothetical protein